MRFYRNNRPALTILFSGTLLGLMVLLFSFSPASGWLNDQGLLFTRYETIREIWDEKEKPAVAPQKKPPVALPASVNTMDSARKEQIGSIKSRQNFLENFVEGDNTCLDHFFASLNSVTEQPVHIWYYGDSQIEGDRLTGELRSLFQGKFGGTGTGYTPFSDLATYRYFELYPAKSLVKYNCFNHKAVKGYGFAGKTYRFAPTDSAAGTTNSIKISKSLRYDKLYLLLGKHPGGKARFSTRDTSIEIAIPPTETFGRVLITDAKYAGVVNITLPAEGVYTGLSFESDKGVQIDNCGIRGHSGDGLRFIPDQVIRSEAATWNTKLVVFHYGNNMIPVIKGDQASMDYYFRFFKGIFGRYRALLPEASILVVSAGDMGTVVDGEEQAYPHVAALAEVMRKAAQQTGCAFFDAHSMIAGGGGILGWKQKGYAGLDGHLSQAGQMKYASTLFAELMREYEVYKLIHTAP